MERLKREMIHSSARDEETERRRDEVEESASLRLFVSSSLRLCSSNDDRTNLEAFQSLLQKFRPKSNLSLVFFPSGSFLTGILTSWVSVAMLARVKRRASAPWVSMIS